MLEWQVCCFSIVVVLVWRRTAHYHQSSQHQNVRFPSCPKMHSCLCSFLVLPVISYIIPDHVTWYLFTWNSIVRCISAALPVLWIQWQHNVIAVCFGSSYQFGICSKTSESFAKCLWLTMLDKAYSQYSRSPFIFPRALPVHRGASGPHVHHSSDIHALTLLWLARERLLHDTVHLDTTHLKQSSKETHCQDLHIQRSLILVWIHWIHSICSLNQQSISLA